MNHSSLHNEVADKLKLVCNKGGSLKDSLEHLHLNNSDMGSVNGVQLTLYDCIDRMSLDRQ